MKKLFVLIFSLASVHFADGQPKGEYARLNTFKGDTLRFLHANFRDGIPKYIGQKFELLLNDFGLGVKWIDVGFSPEGNDLVPGTVHDITLYNRDEGDTMDGKFFKQKGKAHKIVYGLSVVFETPFPVTRNPKWITDAVIGTRTFLTTDPDPFSAAMKLKDAIVKEVKVLEY